MADTRVWVTWEFKTKHYAAEVTCTSCGWKVVFPGESMSWLFRPPVPLDMARRRLRCRRCGRREAEIRQVRR
jgi:DNA-directed RNA polymerase subunit RPC12/RpoP